MAKDLDFPIQLHVLRLISIVLQWPLICLAPECVVVNISHILIHQSSVKVTKVCSYIVWSDHSNQFTFHPWQTCSFRHQPDVCGRYSATPQSLHHEQTPSYFHCCLLPRTRFRADLTGASWREQNCPSFEMIAEHLNLGWLRVFCSTTELPRVFSAPLNRLP